MMNNEEYEYLFFITFRDRPLTAIHGALIIIKGIRASLEKC